MIKIQAHFRIQCQLLWVKMAKLNNHARTTRWKSLTNTKLRAKTSHLTNKTFYPSKKSIKSMSKCFQMEKFLWPMVVKSIYKISKNIKEDYKIRRDRSRTVRIKTKHGCWVKSTHPILTLQANNQKTYCERTSLRPLRMTIKWKTLTWIRELKIPWKGSMTNFPSWIRTCNSSSRSWSQSRMSYSSPVKSIKSVDLRKSSKMTSFWIALLESSWMRTILSPSKLTLVGVIFTTWTTKSKIFPRQTRRLQKITSSTLPHIGRWNQLPTLVRWLVGQGVWRMGE